MGVRAGVSIGGGVEVGSKGRRFFVKIFLTFFLYFFFFDFDFLVGSVVVVDDVRIDDVIGVNVKSVEAV